MTRRTSRTRFEASVDKKRAVESADGAGLVADSMDYRMALMERVHSGQISLEGAQAELKNVKRNAKRNGLKTRDQVWRES